jgi:hypothetical protein
METTILEFGDCKLFISDLLVHRNFQLVNPEKEGLGKAYL